MFDDGLTVVSKRDDPNYSQVSGHIPTEMAKKFKIACTVRGVSHSDGLEQAIAIWLAQEDKAKEMIEERTISQETQTQKSPQGEDKEDA